MNARLEVVIDESGMSPGAAQVRHALRRLLASPAFSKAPRMRHLLSFLVEKKLSGREAELCEHTIGLTVFRRDARVYDTVLDPVVRVQVGRLRNRLAAFYATPDPSHIVRITLPAGSYVPVLSMGIHGAQPVLRKRLELAPLRNLTESRSGGQFVSGLEEELGAKLYQAFGSRIQLRHTVPDVRRICIMDGERMSRLEGSIRIERNRIRASMRIIDGVAGNIAWLTQFDCDGDLGIRLQEELATEICDKLQTYLGGE